MTPFRIRDGLYVRLARLLYARRFQTFGSNVRILFPLDLIGMENISNGDDVQVGHRTTLAALALPGGDVSSLSIGSGTQLGSFNHIYCTRRICIGDNVLTANSVYISDNLHGYADPLQPILRQPLRARPSRATFPNGPTASAIIRRRNWSCERRLRRTDLSRKAQVRPPARADLTAAA